MWAIISVFISGPAGNHLSLVSTNSSLENRGFSSFLKSHPHTLPLPSLHSITPHSQLTFHGGGGIGDSATQGPVSQIIRWKGEEEGGGLVCARNASSLISLIYATGELDETLMKNGKDVMHRIGCLAKAAYLFLIDAWMWGFSGWANGIYTYWMSQPHFICIALSLSAIESHVSWKGGSILHRKCSHLATLVNLYAPWENGFCQFLMFYSIKSSSDIEAMSCSKHPWQLFEVWSQV